jgi:hypothetical protein
MPANVAKAMGRLSSGLYIVTAQQDDARTYVRPCCTQLCPQTFAPESVCFAVARPLHAPDLLATTLAECLCEQIGLSAKNAQCLLLERLSSSCQLQCCALPATNCKRASVCATTALSADPACVLRPGACRHAPVFWYPYTFWLSVCCVFQCDGCQLGEPGLLRAPWSDHCCGKGQGHRVHDAGKG